jgi:uncharacterized protein with FMN-binding domain
VRRALAAIVVTAVVVVLLARYETHPPPRLEPRPTRATGAATPSPTATPRGRNVRSATGPALTTPFSNVQVRVTLTGRRLTGVRTISLTGSDEHTRAINARAEPILREEALRAGSADMDVVSGATYTSRSWIESLERAIEAARD